MIVLVSSNTGTQREITCAVITKYYALGVRNEMRTTPFSVTRIHTSMSLVYNIKRHQYTQLDVTNILDSVSRLYSLVLKGYSHFYL